jgi:uncharacterized protein
MTYAKGRELYDADSHIMELPTFLSNFADPSIRDQLPDVSYRASIVTDEEVAVLMKQGGDQSTQHKEKMIALGDNLIRESKEIQALGSFNGQDRSKAMDLLGFKKQIVFSTLSVPIPFGKKLPPEVQYGAARAHTRAMADFCGSDDRLMGVGSIALDEPDLACQELDFALEAGLKAIWIPHRAPGERSPGHPDFDPFWARLQEADAPFCIHIGGAGLQLPRSWMNNGRPLPKDWTGGGENVRGMDMAVLHHAPERFLSAMVFDGVFERFPKLRGGVVELGAGWVPELLHRLDWTARVFGKMQPELLKGKRKPSQQIIDQVGFTPFVFEDVGRLIEQSHEDLYLFSSDYPHIEGSRDPLGKFDASLKDTNQNAVNKFFSENFQRIFMG